MARVKNIEKVRYNSCKLTDEQVRFVLTRTDLTMTQAADVVGVTASTVQKIRRGESYAWLFPEIERAHVRTTGPRCELCVHDHHGQCSLGFPERAKQGHIAATRCAAYTTQRLELSHVTA